MKKIRILLVEDHPIYREGLCSTLIYSKLNCEVVAEAANVQQAISYIEGHPDGIDLVLLDYFLPDGTGHDVLKAAKRIRPDVKVLLVSGEDDNPELPALMADGLNGFVSKDITPQGLSVVILSIFQGKDFFDKEKMSVQQDSKMAPKIEAFSPREIEIIRLCALGKTSRQIADELFISARTVESHKEKIFNKIGCDSTTEMVNYAFLNGLV